MKKTNSVHVVDMIVLLGRKFVLIERLNFPKGFALPGGKREEGERPIETARRELREETGLDVKTIRYWKTVSGKTRDPRFPTVDRMYIVRASGKVRSEKGKTRVQVLTKRELRRIPKNHFAFDHYDVLNRYTQAPIA